MSSADDTDADPDGYRITVPGSTDGGGRDVPTLTPEEARDRWLNKLRVQRAESTVSAYHYRTEQFLQFCDRAGIEEIGAVSGWDIETYETQRREHGVEPVSLNNELDTLKTFLEYCARVELVDEGLPEKVVPPEVDKHADVDKTRLPDSRAQALFAYHETHACGERSHALLALAWYTGARLNALRGLDIDHYHSDDEYVEFVHEPDRGLPLKNGRGGERAVGFPTYVSEVVDEYIAEHRYERYSDDGARPLIASQNGRASKNAIRAWMYLATQPCLHTDCPHGKARSTCEWVDYSKGGSCPSSRSPHQVRTGSITWQLNRGIPIEVVANRVNTSVRVLKKHYDQPTRREELEQRRRQHLDRLSFGNGGDDS
jgi:site-specific recombinase XerD